MTIFRTERRRNPTTGVAYPWIVPATAMVNQFYVYAVDDDFGPFFIKFGSYFPYTGRVCLNGHEYAKRQAAKAGIGFTALDNGFAALDDPADVAAVQAICDGLAAEAIDGLVRKWLARLPAPIHPRGPGRRVPLPALGAAGRVLPDPGAGPPGLRADLLRTDHPGQPRHRPTGPGRADLRPAGPRRNTPGRVPHPGHHRHRDPEPAHRLQALPDQAVPQGREGAAHRDHDQRHLRLRHRQTAD